MPSTIKLTNTETDRPTVRFMILETDEPHPETQKNKGSYSDILDEHFRKAAKHHKPPLNVETDKRFVVTEKGGKIPKLEDFEGFHAILITGSMFDAHGNNQWILDFLELLKELWTKRPDLRFSGVCFGHQILSRLLGAEVQKAPSDEWELAHSKIDLSGVGKKLFRTDKDHISLHQMHEDQVAAAPTVKTAKGLLPDSAKIYVWGSSGHTEIQGLYIRNRLFTTQAHLAFDDQIVKHEIEMREKSGAIQDADKVDEAQETASFEHDGETVARAILRFYHGEDDEIPENAE